jgi:hypothetical protein
MEIRAASRVVRATSKAARRQVDSKVDRVRRLHPRLRRHRRVMEDPTINLPEALLNGGFLLLEIKKRPGFPRRFF